MLGPLSADLGSLRPGKHDDSIAWMELGADLDDLDAIPASTDALAKIGTPADDFDWIYYMWDGKPAAWFLSWEGVGPHLSPHG